MLADEVRARVVIVDTSNEIGGDGDIPHPGIGDARRMQVGRGRRVGGPVGCRVTIQDWSFLLSILFIMSCTLFHMGNLEHTVHCAISLGHFLA